MAIELLTNIDLEATPSAPQHVPNIAWIQAFFAGRIKLPVRVAATSNQVGTYTTGTQVFAYTAAGAITIDNVTLSVGDRVLLAGQTNPAYNGIFDVTVAGDGGPGELQRADDFDTGNKIFDGLTVAVNAGDDYGNTTLKLTTVEPVVLDTTPLNFSIVSAATTGAQTFAEDIDCDGTATDWQIVHGLGTEDVQIQLWNRVTKGMVLADIEIEDDDTIRVTFDKVMPNTARYRVVVTG